MCNTSQGEDSAKVSLFRFCKNENKKKRCCCCNSIQETDWRCDVWIQMHICNKPSVYIIWYGDSVFFLLHGAVAKLKWTHTWKVLCESIVGTREAEVSTLTSPASCTQGVAAGGETHWHQSVFFPIMAVEGRLKAAPQWRNVFTRNPARRSRWNPWNRPEWEFNFSQAGSNDVKVLLSSAGLGSEQVFCLFRENITVHSWKSESLRHGDFGKTPPSVLLCERCCSVYKVLRSCMWFVGLSTQCWECGLRACWRYWCAKNCCWSAMMKLIITVGQQFVLVSIFLFRQTGRQSVETRVRWYDVAFLLLLLLLRGLTSIQRLTTYTHRHTLDLRPESQLQMEQRWSKHRVDPIALFSPQGTISHFLCVSTNHCVWEQRCRSLCLCSHQPLRPLTSTELDLPRIDLGGRLLNADADDRRLLDL